MKTVFLAYNSSFGGGEEYELIEFKPQGNPQQKGTYLLKPVKQLEKLTKTELIEIIESQG